MPNESKETDNNAMTESRVAGTEKVNGEDKSRGNRSQDSSTLLSQAKNAAGDVYETVADKANSAIEEQKAGLSGKLTGVADTVRRLSGTLHETETENPVSSYAARYTDTAVEKIESMANYFNSADMKDIARDLESYARRNPAIFLGSAFALGIMAARFLKSSPPADPTATSLPTPILGDASSGRREKAQSAATARGN